MNLRFAAILIALSVLALPACGNKGPLVQAPRPPGAEKPSTVPAPVDGLPEQSSPENPTIEPVPEQSTIPPAEPATDTATPPAPDGDGGG